MATSTNGPGVVMIRDQHQMIRSLVPPVAQATLRRDVELHATKEEAEVVPLLARARDVIRDARQQ